MKVPYPKSPEKIFLSQTRYNFEEGLSQKDGPPETISLKDKLDNYFLRLGYTNIHVLSIIVQLFTHGKVRIEFSTYNERLELADKNDLLGRAQAVSLLDDYLAQLNEGNAEEISSNPGTTRRITVQIPKFPYPRPK